jgi:hypothetical protein
MRHVVTLPYELNLSIYSFVYFFHCLNIVSHIDLSERPLTLWSWSSFKYCLRIRSVPQRKQSVTIDKINWLTLFKEIIAVYSENHMKLTDKTCSVLDAQVPLCFRGLTMYGETWELCVFFFVRVPRVLFGLFLFQRPGGQLKPGPVKTVLACRPNSSWRLFN